MATPSAPSFSQLEKETPSQQDAFFLKYFATFKGTVTAAWVRNDAALKPYQGDTALKMYKALAKAYPKATPLERGASVYQTWLVDGVGQTIQSVVNAEGNAAGDTAKGIETASILPGWADPLASFLGALDSANTWIRVAKVIVGGALVIVGLAKLTGVGGIAAKAVKAAPLL